MENYFFGSFAKVQRFFVFQCVGNTIRSNRCNGTRVDDA